MRTIKEPIQEIITFVRQFRSGKAYIGERLNEILEIYKAEQNRIDKIRAEINRQEKWLLQAGYTAYNVDIALSAIKRALAESEDKE